MPTRAYEEAVSVLIAANAVNADEIGVLYEPMSQAIQFNSGLDLAAAHAGSGDIERLVGEWHRVRMKAKRLRARTYRRALRLRRGDGAGPSRRKHVVVDTRLQRRHGYAAATALIHVRRNR